MLFSTHHIVFIVFFEVLLHIIGGGIRGAVMDKAFRDLLTEIKMRNISRNELHYPENR